METVYISGPMTGCKDNNIEAFRKAEAQLRKSGFEVINPHDLILDDIPEEVGDAERWGRTLAQIISVLLEQKPDYIYMLPGWQCSRGACLERALAARLGIIFLPELLIRWDNRY